MLNKVNQKNNSEAKYYTTKLFKAPKCIVNDFFGERKCEIIQAVKPLFQCLTNVNKHVYNNDKKTPIPMILIFNQFILIKLLFTTKTHLLTYLLVVIFTVNEKS